ncbi:LysR family transcriptional regulator [Brachybacterium sacelli]|uniref:DNA-binding transcriptional LysR family regulator n=1 Tax=Brachybacterium sacelli TaxID=173364 RepID=A0ABS4WZ52_9MICO|nr:LysR family transcriptional regulator [Brachybacterium sacelli]MBP2381479.1 DNA-binding transcriptional LysR family regulator [Brachybacterium sacelli]
MYEGDDVSTVWLSSFLAVVDHGSFTAAATATHRSQPRVSAHVAALERRVGARLMERDARRTSLTEAGTRLLPHARAALAEIRAGVASVSSLAGDLQGTVTVGSFAGPSGVLLAPLIRRFRETYPHVVIDLREGTPHWLEEAATTFAVELALRTADVPMQHRLRSEHLMTERIVLAVPEELGDLDGEEQTRHRVLDGRSIVVTGAPAEGWTDFADRLSACGVTPSSVTTVTHPTTVIALVRAGMGVGLLGEMGATVSAFDGVRLLRLSADVWTREIRVYWNDRRRLDTATRFFLDALLEESENR